MIVGTHEERPSIAERADKSFRDGRSAGRRKGMLKRILIALLIIAIVAFCAYYLITHEFTSAAKKGETASRESQTQSVFAELVKKHNAIDSWDKELCQGEAARTTAILTMELEKLWLTDRPILFVGKILDIKTEDKDNYRLIVDRDMFWAAVLSRPFLRTDLQLSVLCPKSLLESFIRMNPDYLDAENGIALVAKIEAVEPLEGADKDAVRGSGRVGKGKCIDLKCLRK
jgi:hypothetical protein